MTLETPTAPHVHWPMGTTWHQAWMAIKWDAKCKRWRCLLNGMFVSKVYAEHVTAEALREVAQAQAQQRAARIEWSALGWAEDEGRVRYGMNADECHVAHNIELFNKELR